MAADFADFAEALCTESWERDETLPEGSES